MALPDDMVDLERIITGHTQNLLGIPSGVDFNTLPAKIRDFMSKAKARGLVLPHPTLDAGPCLVIPLGSEATTRRIRDGNGREVGWLRGAKSEKRENRYRLRLDLDLEIGESGELGTSTLERTRVIVQEEADALLDDVDLTEELG